jgi:hypothetical protein
VFSGLAIKIDNYSLVIGGSKSSRRLLGLGFKTKQATVCWLHHKTNGRMTAWDTCRDLVVCYA